MEIFRDRDLMEACPDWDHQLARVTREAWTGRDGRCYFPYAPLTTPEFWRTHILPDWIEGRMCSWVAVEHGQVVAHAALVDRRTHWELGRLVAVRAGEGVTQALCAVRMEYVETCRLRVVAECTQAHTRSQELSARFGLRFAGIGVLSRIDGIWWDIVYYDNHPAPPFVPRRGVLADPLGIDLACQGHHLERLSQIPAILSTTRGGDLPPTRFHVLPGVEPIVRDIVALNLPV